MGSYQKIKRKRIEDETKEYIGEYKSFKEARKNARKVAEIIGYWAYIEKKKIKIINIYTL